jgi:hypothetical protein
VTSFEIALAPAIGALRADGYDASVTLENEVVHFQITAGPDACEECLTPPTILEPMLTQLLREAGCNESVALRYPTGWKGHM